LVFESGFGRIGGRPSGIIVSSDCTDRSPLEGKKPFMSELNPKSAISIGNTKSAFLTAEPQLIVVFLLFIALIFKN